MKIIGITGASGAGKSTLVKLFNLPVVDADKCAREVTEKGHECLKKLAEVFGSDILFLDGTLDRKLLARKAFASEEKTALLNAVTHPFIVEKMKKEIEFHHKNGERAIIIDAPQLFEASLQNLCDVVIGVIADFSVRKERIKTRDNIDEETALLRINAGKTDDFFKSKCDKIIINNGEIDKLKEEVNKLLKELEI